MTTPTPERKLRRSSGVDTTRTVARARAVARVPGRAARSVARAPVAAVRRPAHAMRDILRYWHAERITLRQGFVALTISSGGDLLAGLALGSMTGRLDQVAGLLLLVPAAIGMRGNVFGALGSRLGTAIHAGLFKLTRARGGVVYQNGYAAMALSIASSVYLAAGARALGAALGVQTESLWTLIAISMIGGVLSSVVVLALTIMLARFAYHRGWDLDSVSGPIVTFVGDTVTLPALFLASFIAHHGPVTTATGVVLAIVGVGSLVMALRTDLHIAKRIVEESVFMLALAGVFVLVAGVVLQHREAQFLGLPALLVMLPAFLEDGGALGAIVSSRLASKLHLGSIRPRLVPERLALLDISLAAPFALSVFTLLGISSHVVAIALGKGSPGLLNMIEISLIAGYLTTLGAAIVSYAGAVATFRFGLDPDNHTIPIVTSTIDLIGTICLVGAIAFVGVR